jgi:hypothetical protein
MSGILVFRKLAYSLTYDSVRSFRPRVVFKPICSPLMPLPALSIMNGILVFRKLAYSLTYDS